MSEVALPGLDGRRPLAFLAALGLLRVLEVHDGSPGRLGWSTHDATATLESEYRSPEAVAEALERVVHGIPEDGVLPGTPTGMPPRGAAPDKLRVPTTALRALAADVLVREAPEGEAWLTSLVTDLAGDDQGRCAITLMAAPSGKQSMRTMLQKPLEAVREDPSLLLEALLGWRRRPGVTGEYLDHQVLFDAADSGDGRSEERGVPGATWLALMAYPLFRTTALAGETISSGWHLRHQRRPTFVYPLWGGGLGTAAITALLEHPIWAEAVDGQLPAQARALGVFAIGRAQRRPVPGRQFAGVLGSLR